MDIKQKKESVSGPKQFERPRDEDIVRARAEKKEQKKKRAERAIQKEKDAFTESYLGSTSASYFDYSHDRHVLRPDVPPSGRLHPGTLAFLEKFRPSIFKNMNLGDKQIPSEKEAGASPSEMPPSVAAQAEEEKDS